MKRSQLKKLQGHAERVFLVGTLILSTEAFLDFIPHALRQVIWFGIYFVTVGLMLKRWRAVVSAARRGALLWVLIGMVGFSVLWSDFPTDTFRQTIAVVGTTLIGLYLAARYTMKEQLWLLAWTFGIIAVLSVLFSIGLPAHGRSGPFWLGIYHQKNLLGRVMLLSAIDFLLMIFSVRKRRWVPWLFFFISLILLVLSGSKTSLALLFTLIALLPFYAAMRLNYKLAVPAVLAQVLVGGGIFVLMLTAAEAVVGAFGKDLTFTGRTDLWGYVLDMIELRPWLGYGFGGFWQGWDGPSAYVWKVEPWYPEHAHNGFLNLWLNLGLIGLLVFAAGYLVALGRGAKLVSLTRTPEYLFPIAYLMFLVLYNLSESVLLLQNTIFWILYVTTVCSRVNPEDLRVVQLARARQVAAQMPPAAAMPIRGGRSPHV
ncbi:MAG TPA: O-antigen ligase [Crinalium sp.]|jgi:O-antigen ligase